MTPGPDDTRIVPCSSCGGDGGHEVLTGYDPRDGSPLGWWERCQTCKGTGDEEIEGQPLELEDLDEIPPPEEWRAAC